MYIHTIKRKMKEEKVLLLITYNASLSNPDAIVTNRWRLLLKALVHIKKSDCSWSSSIMCGRDCLRFPALGLLTRAFLRWSVGSSDTNVSLLFTLALEFVGAVGAYDSRCALVRPENLFIVQLVEGLTDDGVLGPVDGWTPDDVLRLGEICPRWRLGGSGLF